MGPNIGDIGLRLNGRDGWIAQHSIVSTSPDCQKQAPQDLLLCGPIQKGETRTISVSAMPNAAGSYSYEASFYDGSQGRQIALLGPSSPRFTIPGSPPVRYTETWTEVVLPEPTTAVTVTDINGNALGGAKVIVQGSSVSATTASTGVARLGLGPLGPGIYTVVATDAGYIDTGSQITVADFGDPPAVSIEMPSAAAHLAPGSDPSVLPGPILVADEDNNRLVEISPAGQVLWQFPRPGELDTGPT
jgi:hypothetical protein